MIQQRTLRDLREAIKPSPRPRAQIFLPDRFKTTTTELEDGTVIVVDAGPPGPDAYRPPRPAAGREQQVVVEVSPTVAAGSERERRDEGRGEKDGGKLGGDAVEVLRDRNLAEQPPNDRKAKDGGGGKEGGKTKRQKKLSRAERRRQIKEEIQRLAQGNERGLYQPRLW